MEKREVVVSYQVGDTVKITDGALESFLGTVEEIDLDHSKVRVVVSMSVSYTHLAGRTVICMSSPSIAPPPRHSGWGSYEPAPVSYTHLTVEEEWLSCTKS